MDLTNSIAPKSDQLNAEDLIAGPRTFTIAEVRAGSDEQPVNVHLVEFPGRAYRPSKTERRIMVAAWGPESSVYAGRRLTLYRDPEVKFGGDKVGGIKISHLSHIDKRISIALTVTRGRRAPRVVEPLPDSAPTTEVTPDPLAPMFAALAEAGVEKSAILSEVSSILGRDVQGRNDITPDDVQAVVEHLRTKRDADAVQAGGA